MRRVHELHAPGPCLGSWRWCFSWQRTWMMRRSAERLLKKVKQVAGKRRSTIVRSLDCGSAKQRQNRGK
ncbi:hypothetical protein GLYMA_19G096000v4 [Glycine max]|uniref:Uncharacterized protein n=1 Tax=Glycine max TaxID=3847 RepID=A0A0R0EK02_SOYBN|nr:hypothetical protein GLYMA_19G096000v4 [Glycine max]